MKMRATMEDITVIIMATMVNMVTKKNTMKKVITETCIMAVTVTKRNTMKKSTIMVVTVMKKATMAVMKSTESTTRRSTTNMAMRRRDIMVNIIQHLKMWRRAVET